MAISADLVTSEVKRFSAACELVRASIFIATNNELERLEACKKTKKQKNLLFAIVGWWWLLAAIVGCWWLRVAIGGW